MAEAEASGEGDWLQSLPVDAGPVPTRTSGTRPRTIYMECLYVELARKYLCVFYIYIGRSRSVWRHATTASTGVEMGIWPSGQGGSVEDCLY